MLAITGMQYGKPAAAHGLLGCHATDFAPTPIPVRMAKQAINTSANALNHATSFMDADQFLLAATTEDAREGPRAFFEKRTPNFKGN